MPFYRLNFQDKIIVILNSPTVRFYTGKKVAKLITQNTPLKDCWPENIINAWFFRS